MKRPWYAQQELLSSSLAISGVLLAIAGLVPSIVQQQTNLWFWIFAVAGAAVGSGLFIFAVIVRTSQSVFIWFVRIFYGGTLQIRSCADAQIDKVHEMARVFFGENVTTPEQIRSILLKYSNGLQIAVAKGRDGEDEVKGYFFVFPIQKSCVEKIRNHTFSISSLTQSDIAKRPEYGHALYIGGIAAHGIRVRAEVLGAVKASYVIASRTRSKTAYAKAATADGLKLLTQYEFEPVHPKAIGIDCFYMKQF